MKSLKDLEQIQAKTLAKIDAKSSDDGVRVVVGMATCGIAAGARPVLSAIAQEVDKRKLRNVTVCQTGCIGVCRLEPLVEITLPGCEKVTYVNVAPEMAARIVAEHIVNGKPVTEFTIGYFEDNN